MIGHFVYRILSIYGRRLICEWSYDVLMDLSVQLLSAAERRGTLVLLSASVSDNSGNSPKVAALRMPREIDQSAQRFHVGYDWDQSDAVTQNAWFRCALCAAISGEISIIIQTGAESLGRFPVPRICRWESTVHRARMKQDMFEFFKIFPCLPLGPGYK